jgi:uncharacterized protein YtpQ (UPF0354 family)
MKLRIISSILAAIGLSASGAAQGALSPERFTAEFVAALHKALPAQTVTVTEPLRLQLKDRNGEESRAFLDNAYNEYLRDPSAKAAIIDRYLASLAETSAAEEKLDPQRIVPVIKDAAWPREMKRSMGDGAAEQVVEDFNGDLVVVYAEDSPTSTRYFSADQLREAGVSRTELRKLAVTNLRRLLPPPEVHSGPLVSMLTAGGDYVVSLLLLDELWAADRLKVDGEIVVAAPARDILLFTGSNNATGVAQLQEMARKTVAESSYSLTDQLFVYRDGRFQRFKP